MSTFVGIPRIPAAAPEREMPEADRRAVRMALQGGAALSAGTAAARALRQSRPGAALLTAAAGAAVVLAAERWLADRPARPAVIEVDNLVDDAPESQEDASPRYIQMAHTPRDEA